MANFVQTNALTKTYGSSRGIDTITFTITAGEVFGFLGPNGAGKTTTIRTLMGLLKPTAGSATIGNLDCWTQSTEVKRLVGYLPSELALDPALTGAQIIEYLGHLKGGVDQSYVKQLVSRLDLDPSKRFREYSRGNKQKVGLVQAFMTRPQLLILDEPTSGLDPLNQQEFNRMIADVKQEGCTVFLSSHILPEVEHICDRVGIIREGKLIRVDEVAALKDFKQHVIEIMFTGPADMGWFTAISGVTQVTSPAVATIHLTVQGDLSAVIAIAAQHGANNIVTHEPNLEEIFLRFYEPAVPPTSIHS